MRAFLEEAPQAVKVFKRILSKIEEINIERLKISRNEVEIYRAQGTLDTIKTATKNINEVRGF